MNWFDIVRQSLVIEAVERGGRDPFIGGEWPRWAREVRREIEARRGHLEAVERRRSRMSEQGRRASKKQEKKNLARAGMLEWKRKEVRRWVDGIGEKPRELEIEGHKALKAYAEKYAKEREAFGVERFWASGK